MATEKRLIDADALIERFRVVAQSGGAVTYHVSDICAAIEDEAVENAVDAVEVVHGRWEQEISPLGLFRLPKCSHCGIKSFNETKYCPNCGAKMDGDGNG